MSRLPLYFLFPALTLAAVDGTVVNRTSGKPQAAAEVSLIQIGQEGMKPMGAARTDTQGRFRFEDSPQGPILLQTIHQGVHYNTTVQPGSPTTGLTLEIFDVSKSPGAAELSQRVVLLEPSGDGLGVTESYFFSNKGTTTYDDPSNGTVRVLVPDQASSTVRVTATGPNGLPLQRSAEKAGKPNTYKVDFPVKPGETRIDVVYTLPFKSPGKFSTRLLQSATMTRLVAPAGVAVKGNGLEPLGVEPRTQAQIYSVKGAAIEVEVEGAGSVRGAEPAEDEDSGPGVQRILPRLYDRAEVIVGLGVLILALGFLILYRRGGSAATAPAPKGKRRS